MSILLWSAERHHKWGKGSSAQGTVTVNTHILLLIIVSFHFSFFHLPLLSSTTVCVFFAFVKSRCAGSGIQRWVHWHKHKYTERDRDGADSAAFEFILYYNARGSLIFSQQRNYLRYVIESSSNECLSLSGPLPLYLIIKIKDLEESHPRLLFKQCN